MKSRLWLIPLAFLVSGAVAVLLAVLLRPADEQSVALTDGTLVTLKHVTHGKRHTYAPGGTSGRLTALLRRLFPGQSTGTSPLSNTTTNDTLTVWLVETRPTPANTHPYRDFRLVDLARKSSVRPAWNSSSSLNATQMLHGLGFESFPRRQNGALLWLMKSYSEPNREAPAAEFFVANPGPRNFPTWSASPPPVTATDGELEFTLVECRNGVTRGNRGQGRPSNLDDSYAKLAFRVTQNGQSTSDWRPVGVESWDATGNRAVNNNWSSNEEGDQVEIFYRDSLWSDERAWKLRVEFSRAENFAAEDTWEAPAVDLTEGVGKIGENDPGLASTNLGGVTITVRGVEAGRSPNDSAQLRVRVEPPLKNSRFTLVSLTDENGDKLETTGSGWSSDGKKSDYGFMLRRLSDAKALRAKFAMHRSRYAEFLVEPEEGP